MRERPRLILDELAITAAGGGVGRALPVRSQEVRVRVGAVARCRAFDGRRTPTCRVQRSRHPGRSPRPTRLATTSGPRVLANRYFDAILVHSDPQFARLEDTFHPAIAADGSGPLHGVRDQQRRPDRNRPRATVCNGCWSQRAAGWSEARCSRSSSTPTVVGTTRPGFPPRCSPDRSPLSLSGRGCRIKRDDSTASKRCVTCRTCAPRWHARRSRSASAGTTRPWTSCAPVYRRWSFRSRRVARTSSVSAPNASTTWECCAAWRRRISTPTVWPTQ